MDRLGPENKGRTKRGREEVILKTLDEDTLGLGRRLTSSSQSLPRRSAGNTVFGRIRAHFNGFPKSPIKLSQFPLKKRPIRVTNFTYAEFP